mmetsp:Transcript_73712/g.172972  ORF Transcript_73712/g.172972 Transcript_73712/m.172972 type:complete len:363 (+) Transcript_73712:248-1336(+)
MVSTPNPPDAGALDHHPPGLVHVCGGSAERCPCGLQCAHAGACFGAVGLLGGSHCGLEGPQAWSDADLLDLCRHRRQAVHRRSRLQALDQALCLPRLRTSALCSLPPGWLLHVRWGPLLQRRRARGPAGWHQQRHFPDLRGKDRAIPSRESMLAVPVAARRRANHPDSDGHLPPGLGSLPALPGFCQRVVDKEAWRLGPRCCGMDHLFYLCCDHHLDCFLDRPGGGADQSPGHFGWLRRDRPEHRRGGARVCGSSGHGPGLGLSDLRRATGDSGADEGAGHLPREAPGDFRGATAAIDTPAEVQLLEEALRISAKPRVLAGQYPWQVAPVWPTLRCDVHRPVLFEDSAHLRSGLLRPVCRPP